MLTQRAVMTLRKHARVTSRAGRFKARVGETTILVRDQGGVANITTRKDDESPIRHRSIASALRVALHKGTVVVSPAGAEGLQVAIGIARGQNLEPTVYVLAVLLSRDRRAGDTIQGGEISSAKSEDITWVESFLAGGISDDALMDWLEARGGKVAETIRLARQC